VQKTETGLPVYIIFIILLLVPVAFYWRYDLFFLWDDWTELDFISHNNFTSYLVMPNGEIFFPFFHLIFYALLKSVGEYHGFFVLVNCLGTGVAAFLIYLFFRNHLSSNLSLILSLLYAGSAVHPAIAWNAFYLCYILCLIFFMAALLLTDFYIKSSSYRALWGIGLFAWLSIHSHNYTLLALLVLPLYVLFMGGIRSLRKALTLAGVIGILLLSFAWEYLTFAGIKSTTFFNQGVLSTVPDYTFFTFWICGAFLSPVYFLFGGHFQVPLLAVIFGNLVLGFCVLVIWVMGTPLEKRLGIWALLLNALPFLMVSLGRYMFAYEYAFTARYVFFTLVGAMLLVGITWTIVSRRVPAGNFRRLLAFGIMGAMISSQIFTMPFWQKGYLHMSRKALNSYQAEEGLINDGMLLVNPQHPLEASQVSTIRQFLKNEVWLRDKAE
jgi:xanthosine utilization system XapX-like protein